MSNMKFFFAIICTLMLSCNIEVDTINPQASRNIVFAKNNKLFVKEFVSLENLSQCKVVNSWVEYAWKYEMSNAKKIKRFNRLQFIIISDLRELNLDASMYLMDWEIMDSKNRSLGRSNGVFVLNVTRDDLQNDIILYIKRIDSNAPLCTITLRPAL